MATYRAIGERSDPSGLSWCDEEHQEWPHEVELLLDRQAPEVADRSRELVGKLHEVHKEHPERRLRSNASRVEALEEPRQQMERGEDGEKIDGKNAERSPRVERGEVPIAALVVGEDARDEESRQHEEQIHADP